MSTPEVQNLVTALAYEDRTASSTVPFSAGGGGEGGGGEMSKMRRQSE